MAVSHNQYGLIGLKLGHSFSKDYFSKKFFNEGIDAEYLNFEIPSADCLTDIVRSNPNLKGLNVTIPYKESVIRFLDYVDPVAQGIGAVNTIKIEHRNGNVILSGYNTDIIGFTDSIRPFLKKNDKKALILGSGGAAKAIFAGLIMLGIEPTFVSRKKRPGIMTYPELTSETMANHSVIVNTTPLGMWPDTESCPDIPYDSICKNNIVFDAIYNPDPTLFLKKCRKNGATAISGIQMLYGQAEASWKIWNDQMPT